MNLIIKDTDFITISIYGTGTATIDWGDGVVKTLTLSSDLSDYKEFKHDYSDSASYTITISGKNITYLNCLYALTNIDVSRNTELKKLICTGNLTSLDVSKNTALRELSCSSNQLTSLDVSKNTELTLLDCNNNQLMDLDISKNTELKQLDCYDNQLTNLDVSRNSKLEILRCNNNQLTNLDISQNTMLIKLRCFGNQLKSLDTSKNTSITNLDCSINQLSTNALNDLFKTLHEYGFGVGITKTILISNNPGTTYCNTNIATGKGWMVKID